jgi:catechol 2,3-dioxygenase-like lactoylglutathione lyase family enzyme
MIGEFAHVGIGVFNLEESVRFYAEVIGMEIEYRAHHEGAGISQVVNVDNAHLNVCMMRKGGMRIELIEYFDRTKKRVTSTDQAIPGLLHLAFKVDDVDAVHRKLESMGYRFHSHPMVTRENGPKICYFLGPDNVTMELYQETMTPKRTAP